MVLDLKGKAYTISTEGSNGVDMKLYPIVFTYLDEKLLKFVKCHLYVPNLKGKSTGEDIANSCLKWTWHKKNPVFYLEWKIPM